MNTLIRFMQDYVGRAVRVILGLALIYIGIAAVGGTLGTILAIVGILPIAMGVWGPCLLGFVYKPRHA
jgi:DUF2892 family protein